MGMKATGSGEKNLVEDCLALDLAWLMRLGPIREGQAGNGEIHWNRCGFHFSARFRLDLLDPDAGCLTVRYSLPWQGMLGRQVRQAVTLTSTPQHFGGRRWWMRCPDTGERVRILYLAPGGRKFASRGALGLSYQVEQQNRFDRPFEKLFRAQRKLDGGGKLGAEIQRPKGMWRRTFVRHIEKIAALDLACADHIGLHFSNAKRDPLTS